MSPQPRPVEPASIALVLLSLVAGLGMGRLFQGMDHVVGIAVAVALAHGLSTYGRLRNWPAVLVGSAGLGSLVLASVWTVFPQTTAYGIPGPGTYRAVTTELSEAWRQFAEVVAPVPPRPGFVFAAMLGIGVAALLADWAATRIGGTFEALIPTAAVFVFTATLGGPGGRNLATAGYLAAAALFVVLHHAGRRAGAADWFAGEEHGAVPMLLRAGGIVGAAAIALSLVIGPNLPGADAPAILGWRENGLGRGGGGRTTISPLVDIRGRLTDNSDAPVFTVRSNHKAYWRLMSLDSFDGVIWSAQGNYDPVDERLPGGVTAEVPVDVAVQEFTISSLASIWLPAAFVPTRLEGGGDVRYDRASGALITDAPTSDGLTYRVESALPRLDSASLAGVLPGLADDDLERYVALPPISERVARLARTLAPEGASPYDQAIAIQDYFRSRYTYDLDAPTGHDGDAIERFVFESRRGYCEQFAGAFAVMARSVGLPTRVAVGFTPGELGADGLYHVRALNAHAWPEVFMEGFGWVAFEPTPGRGAPGAEAYTGAPEAQAEPRNPETATTAVPTTSTTVATGPSDTAAPTIPESEEPGTSGATGADDRPAWVQLLLVGLGGVLVVTLAWVAVVPWLHRRRRRAIWAGADDGSSVTLAAWRSIDADLRRVEPAAARRPAETPLDHVRRVGPIARLAPEQVAGLRRLAVSVTAALYSPDGVDDTTAADARALAAGFTQWADERVGRRRRIRMALDPRPLLAGTGEHTVHEQPLVPVAEASPTRRNLTKV